MHLDCERAMKLIIPAARMALSNELSKRYDMTQSEIAKRLGVKQATVSNYLHGRHSRNLHALGEMLVRDGKLSAMISSALANKSVDARIDALASDSHIVRQALALA